jgi:hypothetical protein
MTGWIIALVITAGIWWSVRRVRGSFWPTGLPEGYEVALGRAYPHQDRLVLTKAGKVIFVSHITDIYGYPSCALAVRRAAWAHYHMDPPKPEEPS